MHEADVDEMIEPKHTTQVNLVMVIQNHDLQSMFTYLCTSCSFLNLNANLPPSSPTPQRHQRL